jgi:ketosteroid isomerase-like protein
MNNRLLSIGPIVVFIFCFCASAGAQQNDPAVVEVLAKYDAAWNKKDTKTVDSILAPGYIYFSSTGGLTPRARTLEFLISPKYTLTFAERTEIQTYRTGNTVIVSSRWKGKGTYDQGAIDDDQRCGLVFVKLGKAWKLVSEHCAQIVTK